MQVFLRIDLNLFMAAVCLIVYLTSRNISEKRLLHNRIFRWLALCVFCLLVLESLTWLLDGGATQPLILCNQVVTMLLFLLTPIPGFLWVLYVQSQLFHDEKALRLPLLIYGIPIGICELITLSTPLTHGMYYFDLSHIYHRGPWYALLALLSILPLITSVIAVWVHQSRISRKAAWMLTLFSVITLTSSLAQVLFYGIAVIWSSITIALLVAYTSVQNDQVYLDHLTGLFNRRQMDIHLSDRVRMAKDGRPLSCILLDIDQFKQVNDRLGHVAGDAALADAASILQASIRKGDFLARYGGDEFVILTDIDNEQTLNMLLLRIQQRAREFNETQNRAYAIRFSAGSAVYRPESGWDEQTFIRFVDALMYQDKAENGAKAGRTVRLDERTPSEQTGA
jgi:diguanylate cyclase (GGDEF)-like protein